MDFLERSLRFFAYSDPEPLLLAVLVLSTLIVADRIGRSVQRRRTAAGLTADESPVVSVDGGKGLTVREYVSEIQGLAGRPDALIRENGFVIPIERKPLARKLRDRHVAQLLVYMRLIEEFEGRKPPYGYLILGPNCRRVTIYNSPERQAWLQSIIDQMRAIRAGGAADPDPHPRKCRRCSVRQWCASRAHERPAGGADGEAPFVQIGARDRGPGRAA